MGILYESELIVGFELDSDIMKKWLDKNKIDLDCYQIDDKLGELFPEMIEEDMEIYVVCCIPYYDSSGYEYYLSFVKGSSTVKELNQIDTKKLNLAKKIYFEFMNQELDCKDVSDIPIFSVLNVN